MKVKDGGSRWSAMLVPPPPPTATILNLPYQLHILPACSKSSVYPPAPTLHTAIDITLIERDRWMVEVLPGSCLSHPLRVEVLCWWHGWLAMACIASLTVISPSYTNRTWATRFVMDDSSGIRRLPVSIIPRFKELLIFSNLMLMSCPSFWRKVVPNANTTYQAY